MKHAYLILAHNEFLVLDFLLQSLDDERNEIVIHFDKKVKELPDLKVEKAHLTFLEDRFDLSWGDVSIVQAEFALFEHALKLKDVSYFHVLSGVHLPLKTQDEIHDYYKGLNGKSVFKPMGSNAYELNYKMQYYHYFVRQMASSSFAKAFVFNKLNNFSIRIQKLFGMNRFEQLHLKKASQWCSLNRNVLTYLVDRKIDILKKYKNSLCSDELFIVTELFNYSSLWEEVIFDDHIILTDFHGSRPKVFERADYQLLVDSACLFARKFSESDLVIVEKLTQYIKSK